MNRQQLGAWGEDLVARHLAATGHTLLARNWRCPVGEIDIVAVTPAGVLAMVEVKTRRSVAFGSPAEAITPQKHARLRRLAASWLAEHPHRGDVRIDVAAVRVPPSGAPQLDYIAGIRP